MKLTDQEGQRLVSAMLAMRPDWIPNKPGRTLHTANEADGLPFAQDFGHALRALAAYATETGRDGRPAKRIPDYYLEAGKHWTSTATEPTTLPQGPPCEDHPEQEATNCRCCWADHKVGQRPVSHIGKHFNESGKAA